MTDLLARLRIEATASDTPAVAARVERALDGVGDTARRTGAAMAGADSGARRMAAGLDQAGDQAQRLDTRLRGSASGAALLGSALGAIGAGAFVNDITKAAFAAGGLEVGLGAVTGGAAQAKAEMGFVRQEANRLGLEVQSATREFLSLAAATNGTVLAGQDTRDIWLATAEAGMALGRAPEQIGRGLEALSQIAGKGVVSMEEVRQQLAEAIPAAAVIGARALNLTSAEFNKLVESGELTADVFLPAFAAQLREEFGPAIDDYMNSPLGRARQAIGETQTSLNYLRVAAGEGFLEGVTDGLDRLNDVLGDGDTAADARELGAALGEGAAVAADAVGVLVDNIELVQTAAMALGGVALARWMGTAAVATQGLAAQLLATGSAAGVARLGLTSLLALVGGPVGAAFLATGAAVYYTVQAVQASEEAFTSVNDAVAATAAEYERARQAQAALGGESGRLVSAQDSAAVAAAQLTGEVSKLADEHYRAAAAAKAQILEELRLRAITAGGQAEAAVDNFNRRRASLRGQSYGALAAGGRGAGPSELAASYASADELALQTEEFRTLAPAARNARTAAEQYLAERARGLDDYLTAPTPSGGSNDGGSGGSGRGRADRAADLAEDLAREEAARRSHTAAVIAGEAALDAWRIAQAGAEAVARAGSEAVRDQAEAVERLAIADERIEAAAGFTRAAERDTEALRRRAIAAAEGRTALEALRISEAGLAVLQDARVTSLDQLSGLEREQVENAVRAAEAKERQAIATEQAEAAGRTVEELEQEIAAEGRRQAAIGRGIEAEVAYARAEFIRLEVERAGLEITDAAAQAIIAKADALFTLRAANDNAQVADDLDRELRLLRLTARERELAVRAERILRDLAAERVDLAGEALASEADRRAQAELEAEESAAAVGRITTSLRDGFIREGSLGIDELADYAEEQLRAALYDAFLAEPIRIVVEATVDIVNDLAKQIFGGSSAKGFLSDLLGAGGRLAGLGQVLGGAGVGGAIGTSLGLGSGNGLLDAGLSIGGSALGGMLGTGMGVFSAASSALGGSMLGSIAGLLGPVMGPLGALAGVALGTLLKDEKRPYTRADIVAQGGQFVVAGTQAVDGGGKQVADELGKAITESLNAASKLFGIDVAKLEGLYTTAGYVSGGNYKALGGEGYFGGDVRGSIDFFNQAGTDLKGNTLGAGVTYSQVGDAEALAEQVVRETILRAIAAGASDLTAAEASLVQASESLEEAIALIGTARGFGDRIDDMLLEILDPAAFERQKALDAVEATYQALRAEAQQLIDAGLLTGDVLVKIEQLRDLQRDAALNDLDGGSGGNPFRQVRDRLQGWLDELATSDLAPGDVRTQRNEAFDQYQRQLAAAQGGDAAALSDITGYADRLIRLDRAATGSATARQALYDAVTADVRALVGRGVVDEPLTASAIADPIVGAIGGLPGALADVLGGGSNDNRPLVTPTAFGPDPNVVLLPDLRVSGGAGPDAGVGRLAETLDARLRALEDTMGGTLAALIDAQSAAGESAEGSARLQLQALQDLTTQVRIGGLIARAQAA